MAKRDISMVAFRLLGLYFVALALFSIPELFLIPEYVRISATSSHSFGPTIPVWATVLAYLGPFVLELAAGVIIWVKAPSIACGIFSSDNTDVEEAVGGMSAWIPAALMVLGLYLIVFAVPNVIAMIATHNSLRYSQGISVPGIGQLAKPGQSPGISYDVLARYLLQIVIGFLLIFRSSAITNLILRDTQDIVEGVDET